MPEKIRKTRDALIEAAWAEFEQVGYEATNTNKIARRAGFAPQTFYRHFRDKTEIFLLVYERWVDQEQALLANVRDAERAAEVAIQHHRESRNFRRALRRLSISVPEIRAARAKSRLWQIEELRFRLTHLREVDVADLAARLLMVERLTDACAEEEFSDLGIAPETASRVLTDLLRQAFAKP